jgi:hypothetical protein
MGSSMKLLAMAAMAAIAIGCSDGKGRENAGIGSDEGAGDIVSILTHTMWHSSGGDILVRFMDDGHFTASVAGDGGFHDGTYRVENGEILLLLGSAPSRMDDSLERNLLLEAFGEYGIAKYIYDLHYKSFFSKYRLVSDGFSLYSSAAPEENGEYDVFGILVVKKTGLLLLDENVTIHGEPHANDGGASFPVSSLYPRVAGAQAHDGFAWNQAEKQMDFLVPGTLLTYIGKSKAMTGGKYWYYISLNDSRPAFWIETEEKNETTSDAIDFSSIEERVRTELEGAGLLP